MQYGTIEDTAVAVSTTMPVLKPAPGGTTTIIPPIIYNPPTTTTGGVTGGSQPEQGPTIAATAPCGSCGRPVLLPGQTPAAQAASVAAAAQPGATSTLTAGFGSLPWWLWLALLLAVAAGIQQEKK
jgi:hypothetical protein